MTLEEVLNEKHAIQTALEELGKTHEDIAKTLHQQQITGVPGCTENCPLARYLRTKGIRAYVQNTHVETADTELPLGIEATMFVELFDAGRYPYLEQA